MKLFNMRALLIALATVSVFYLTGCDDEESEFVDPEITITQPAEDLEITQGDTTINFEILAKKGVDGKDLDMLTGTVNRPILGVTTYDFDPTRLLT